MVSTAAFILQNAPPKKRKGQFLRLTEGKSEREKSELFKALAKNGGRGIYTHPQEDFYAIPSFPVCYWLPQKTVDAFRDYPLFGSLVDPRKGMVTADNDRFIRLNWEVSQKKVGRGYSGRSDAKSSGCKWFPYSKGGERRKWYGNDDCVVDWESDGKVLQSRRHPTEDRVWATNFNLDYIFRPYLTWTDITTDGLAARLVPHGTLFDSTSWSAFQINEGTTLNYVAAICNTKVGQYLSLVLNPTLHFTSGDFARLPLIQADVSAVTDGVQIMLCQARSDWDAYETSWDFTTLPLLASEHRDQTLAGSYARLRAHWQGMTEEMQRLEEENNRIFIDAYGLADELTPEVPLEEITLTCNPAYRYGSKAEDLETRLRADTIAEFLHYAVGCMFGRYSLDTPGLILANQGEGLADYLARVPEPSFDVDADNVIPVLDGDWFADDITERFRKFLRVTFGEAQFQENLAFIEDALGKDIRKYFTKDFFDTHVRRYKKRPIYWMFSSPKGTFNALIYMHRYRPDTVSVVLNDYLREFISRLEGERGRLEKLSDDPSASQGQRTKALKDIAVIAKQIDELNDWERDVVFPLAQAKIEIDLDDGVKRNYPLFGAALKLIKGLEGTDD